MNDPREMITNSECVGILEQDNRKEERYQWGAMIVDLCDMPVSEYMKPMTVIGLGGGSADTGVTMYTLKFIVDGEVVFSQELNSGDVIPFTVNAEKEDRRFKGWYYGSTPYKEGAIMPSKHLTLTANYECDVTFLFSYDGNEEFVSSYTVDYNSKLVNIPSTDNVEGYNFKGWEPSISNIVKQHTTYVASFEIKKYVVKWYGYNTEVYPNGIKEETYSHGDILVEPTHPQKVGHTFLGWNNILPEKVTSNLDFIANFEVNTYEIKYIIDIDGEKHIWSTETQKYNNIISLQPTPSIEGYTFTPWEGYEDGMRMPANNVEFVTYRSTNSYTIYYYDNGELLPYQDTVLYGATIEPYKYEKEGWIVNEWENLPLTMPHYDIHVYCTSQIKTFSITFVDQNGITYVMEDIPYGTNVSEILPKIEGHTVEVNDEEILNGEIIDSITIDCVVTTNSYKANITINGEKVDAAELLYGTNVDEYIEVNFPEKEGYEKKVYKSHDTVPSDNSLVIEVTYVPKEWTLKYITNDVINGEVTVKFDEFIYPYLPSTDLEGKNFSGWRTDEGEGVTEETKMPNRDLEVSGEFTTIEFSISIYNGENIIASIMLPYGSKLSEALNHEDVVNYVTEQSANGYTVIFNDVDENMTIVEDVTVYTSMIPNKYILTFMNGEEVYSMSEIDFGSVINYPLMENKIEGGIEYVFVWEDYSYNEKTMPPYNVTIVGNYQVKAEAPIYYGSFVIPVSSYTSESLSDYVSESDLNSEYYKTVAVSECIDVEKPLAFVYPAYQPFIGLSNLKLAQEKKKYYEPLTVLLPVSIVEKYDISLKDGVLGTERWVYMTSDNVIKTVNGNNYYVFAIADDGTRADAVESVYNYKMKLTEK